MLAAAAVLLAGGFLQTVLLMQEGASDINAGVQREMRETLEYLAPVVADHALVGDYAAIEQLLKMQVTRSGITALRWSDRDDRVLRAEGPGYVRTAPHWFAELTGIRASGPTIVDVVVGGVSYGKLSGWMTSIPAENRLWMRFVEQIEILAVMLALTLLSIWLIFRSSLATLRGLAAGANRFSSGDHAVRIPADGAPEVRQAAQAFNDMAENTGNLLVSLGRSEAKSRLLATVVEQSGEAIWTVDLGGRVTSWNAGAVALFGLSADAAIGQPPHFASLVRPAPARLERFSYDTRLHNIPGEPIDVQVAVAPLLDESGRCTGWISLARDTTARTRSEEALRMARAAAESASVAKSAFLARMSHEIRTPMNGVLGMTELLLETALDQTQRKYAETVHRSGATLLDIINDVLDFSKIEAGKLELEHVPFDALSTVEDVLDMLAEQAHVKGIELSCRMPACWPSRVVGDPIRVRQVLVNLVGNAVKFTSSGSVLLTVLASDEGPDQVALCFAVSDTGEGIAPEAQERIFEEFSQADGSTTRHHGGSGLGLAISRQLAQMMSGSIELESSPGQGSTFRFRATFQRESPARALSAATAAQRPFEGMRVLVAEAGSAPPGLLAERLAGRGIAVQTAADCGQAASLMAAAAAAGTPYPVAIIDLGTQGGDPAALVRSIRTKAPPGTLRLLMLAPMGRQVELPQLLADGLDDYLIKPVREAALLAALKKCLEPRVPPGARKDGRATPLAANDGSEPGRVLLVEDNPVNQVVAMSLLRRLLGCEVSVANNGREAIDAWRASAYDLVLMDCQMPVMDGFEATREIRRIEASRGGLQRRRTPIIALTANAMVQDREACLHAGMDDHLGKPFNRKQMEAMLERWLAVDAGAEPCSNQSARAPDSRTTLR